MTCPTSTYFDADLDGYLRQQRPEWFAKPRHNSSENKRILLEAAQRGGSRTELSVAMNNALNHYCSPKSRSRDTKFRNTIMNLRPDWFIKGRNDLNRDKLKLAAQTGASRKAVLSLLRSFTQPSSALYSEEFTAELHQLRPDWFEHVSAPLKRDIISHAQTGAPQPSLTTTTRRIYLGFRRYARETGEQFDPAFRETLMQIRPDWFVGRANRRIIDPSPQ